MRRRRDEKGEGESLGLFKGNMLDGEGNENTTEKQYYRMITQREEEHKGRGECRAGFLKEVQGMAKRE